MIDLSSQRVVRANATLFPILEFEAAAYERYGIQPVEIEAASPDEVCAHAADCDALVVVSQALLAHVIDGLRRCRVISRVGAGTDKIDAHAVTRNGILLTNIPDFCAEEQADHTMALLLALVRKLPQMRRAMEEGAWTRSRAACAAIRRVRGSVLGLVGFGFSAREVAARAAAFGMRVIATRRQKDAPNTEAAALGVEMVELDELLSRADIVSLHLPLTDETRHLFDAKRFRTMKPGAYLINTSRGGIVDESALVEALKNGIVAGAGLDTFAEIDLHGSEESPPDHPLLALGNVVLTPHVAAYSREAMRDVGVGAVENAAMVLLGHWPRPDRIVNRGVTPRSRLADYDPARLSR